MTFGQKCNNLTLYWPANVITDIIIYPFTLVVFILDISVIKFSLIAIPLSLSICVAGDLRLNTFFAVKDF